MHVCGGSGIFPWDIGPTLFFAEVYRYVVIYMSLLYVAQGVLRPRVLLFYSPKGLLKPRSTTSTL